jgi:hypothetical protein
MSCNGPHVPQEYLFKAPDQKVATLVTNNKLSNELAEKHLPKISNFDVEIGGGKFVAKVSRGIHLNLWREMHARTTFSAV